MKPVPSSITKTYNSRGPLQQYRFEAATAFECIRCGQSKKAKLISVYLSDWSKKLCNGCYGELLSIYEIKAGTGPEDQRALKLAASLLKSASEDEKRQAVRLLIAAEKRTENLTEEAVRFLATAEHVAQHLDSHPQLEWSPAVIGLCTAVEAEILARVLVPLSKLVKPDQLLTDKKDKDIGRVATFCADPRKKPPELGTFAHFLQTLIHSEHRRETSTLIQLFLKQASNWIKSEWLLAPDGFHRDLLYLTQNFRNPAAHIDELGQDEYYKCREHVIGEGGMLWKFVLATEAE